MTSRLVHLSLFVVDVMLVCVPCVRYMWVGACGRGVSFIDWLCVLTGAFAVHVLQFVRTGDDEKPITLEFNEHPPPPPPPFLVSPLVRTVKAYSSASFVVTFPPPENLEAFKAVMVADAAWMFPDDAEVRIVCGHIITCHHTFRCNSYVLPWSTNTNRVCLFMCRPRVLCRPRMFP